MVHFNTLLTAVALYSAVVFAAPDGHVEMGAATTSTAMMAGQTPPMKEAAPPPPPAYTPPASPMMGTTSTSSSTIHESTSSTSAYDSTSTTSTSSMAETTTTSSMAMPTYGSGSSNWGNAYNDCVQQCVAKFSAPVATWTPTATATEGSRGTGATHTVIVAPSAGVLRYVPFAVNASVGDTVKFMWGANTHTVTKGSALALCNKTEDAPFASGLQNKSFVFEQVVNDTKPTFFYCAAPTHCQKGMFGIINPPVSFGVAASAMAQMAMNSTDMAAMTAYSQMMSKASVPAGNWGSNINIGEMPPWAQPLAAENIYYTRMYLAANKELIKDDGKVDLGAGNGAPMAIPQDVTVALNAAGSGGAAVGAGSGSSATTSADPSASTTAAPSSASPLATSNFFAALLAIAAALFLI